MEQFYPQNPVDEQRRQLIMQRLEEERELRRKHIREGKSLVIH